MDTDEDVLVAFQVNWKKNPLEVQKTKWKLMTGELLEKKQFHLMIDHIGVVNEGAVLQRSGTNRHTLGHMTVCELFVVSEGKLKYLLLRYDHAIDELSARWTEYPPSFSRPGGMADSIVLPTSNIVYYWDRNARQSAIYDITIGTTTLSPNYRLDS